jgi:hypothetical protein
MVIMTGCPEMSVKNYNTIPRTKWKRTERELQKVGKS